MIVVPPGRARLLVCLVAGLALPLAFAPFGLFAVAPLSYAALFWAWQGTRPPGAFGLGFLYGGASFGAGTYWTFIAVHGFGELPIPIAVIISGGLVVTLALFVGLAGYVAARWLTTRGPLAWLVVLPSVFVLTEWLRGWAFTGFGWLSAGYSQTDSWLMGWAPVLGLHGMSWAVLLVAGALSTLLFAGAAATRARFAALGVLAVVAGGGWAAGRIEWTTPKDRTLEVAILQGAVQQDLKWRPEQLPVTLETYEALMAQSIGSDLIVWPEAAIPDLYERMMPYLESVRQWAHEHDAVVMLGILSQGPNARAFRNVLVALTDPHTIYVKRHLVPFGEYYPVPSFMRDWVTLMNLPNSDAVPGPAEQPPIDALGEKIAVTICYEDVFGAEQLHSLRDATLLVNVSNDAWFGDSIAPHQHLQIARLRAAEAGRYLLRSTNTGVSAVIDARGAVQATIPQFTPAVLKHSVRPYIGATPYARLGNYPVLLAVALSLVVARVLQARVVNRFDDRRRYL